MEDKYLLVDSEKFFECFKIYEENKSKAEYGRIYLNQDDYKNYKYVSNIYLHSYTHLYKDKIILSQEITKIRDYKYIVNATYFNIDISEYI